MLVKKRMGEWAEQQGVHDQRGNGTRGAQVIVEMVRWRTQTHTHTHTHTHTDTHIYTS